MASEPKVSVILTTKNEAAILWRSVLSVLAQSEAAWELIVVDRGSTDATEELMNEFGDPRIRRIPALAISTAAARRLGTGVARGEYVAYLTADSGWHANFLQAMLARAEGDPHGMFWHARERIYEYETLEDGRRVLANVRDSGPAETCGTGAHTWFHRRAVLGLVGGWDPEQVGEVDASFLAQFAARHRHCLREVDEVLSERRNAFRSAGDEGSKQTRLSPPRTFGRAARERSAFRRRRTEWN